MPNSVRLRVQVLTCFGALATTVAASGCAADATAPFPSESTASESSAYRVNSPTTALTYHGGTGGYDDWPACGAGNVVTGVFGTYGSYVDQMGFWCAHLNENGTLTPIAPTAEVGGTGGSWYDFTCPANQMMVGAYGWSHTYVDSLGWIACAPAGGSTGDPNTVSWYGDQEQGMAGGIGGDYWSWEVCPVNYAVTYAHVRAGSWIDALQLYCQYVNPYQ